MISFEIFQFAFMQRALITGTAVAIICSVIGLFLVLRRQSLFGDAMSHVSFWRYCFGNIFKFISYMDSIYCLSIAALGITKLKESTKIPSDSAIAILLSSGLALGVVLISLSQGFSLDLFRLFIWKYFIGRFPRRNNCFSTKHCYYFHYLFVIQEINVYNFQ